MSSLNDIEKQYEALKQDKNYEGTCFIYVRVSDLKQIDNLTLKVQEEECKRKAESLKLKVIRMFVDKGESGRTIFRQQFMEMMKIINQNPRSVNAVIFYNITRLGRNSKNTLEIAERFMKYKINIISVKEDINYDSPGGKFQFQLLANLAELESNNIKERIKPSQELRAREGLWNGARFIPFGYVNTPITDKPKKNGKFEKVLKEIKEEADQIRIIFDLYVNGTEKNKKLGQHLIVKHLIENGYKYRDGKEWTTKRVSSVLQNAHLYAGYIRWNEKKTEFKTKYNPVTGQDDLVYSNVGKSKGKPVIVRIDNPEDEVITVKGEHDKIITEEIYEKFKKVYATKPKPSLKNKGRNAKYLLTSIIRCMDCDGVMDHGTESYGAVYKCRLATASPGMCSANSMKEEYILEDAFKVFFPYLKLMLFFQFPKAIMEKSVYSGFNAKNDKEKEYKVLKDNIKRETDILQEKFNAFMKDEDLQEMFMAYFEKKKKEIREMEQRLSVLEEAITFEELNADFIKEVIKDYSKFNDIKLYFDSLVQDTRIDYFRQVFNAIRYKKNKNSRGRKSIEFIEYYLNADEIRPPSEEDIADIIRNKEVLQKSELIENMLQEKQDLLEIYDEIINEIIVVNKQYKIKLVYKDMDIPSEDYQIILEAMSAAIKSERTLIGIEDTVDKSMEVAKRFGIELTEEEIAEALKEVKAGS